MSLRAESPAKHYLEEAFQGSTLPQEAIAAILEHGPTFIDLMVQRSQTLEPYERRYIFVLAEIQGDQSLKTEKAINNRFLNPLELLRHQINQKAKMTGGTFGLVNRGLERAYDSYLRDSHQ